MAVVGNATVVVRALVDRFKQDLQRGFRDAERDADRGGENAGESFSKRFAQKLENLDNAFLSKMSSAREAGATGGDAAGGSFLSRFTGKLNALDSAVADRLRGSRNAAGSEGDESGSSFVSRFASRLGALDDAVIDRLRGTRSGSRDSGSDAGGAWSTGFMNRLRSIDDRALDSLRRLRSRARDEGDSSGDSFATALQSSISRMRVDFPNFGGRLGLKILAILPIIGVLGGALAALGGGFLGLVGVVGQASAALAAFPGILGGVIATVLAGVVAFGGVSEAFKSLGKQQAASGKDALTAARQQEQAARQIEAAQEGVENAQEAVRTAQRRVRDANEAVVEAQERVIDAQKRVERADESLADSKRDLARAFEDSARDNEAAAEDTEDAERDLIRALQDEKNAQRELKAAREAAKESLEDAAFSARGAALGAEAAELRLADARARLNDVNGDVTATDRQRQDASLAYREAQLAYDEAIDRRDDANKAQAEAIKKGVEGSDEVVAAQDRIVRAQEQRREAAERLQEAQETQARAEIDNARRIEDAQRRVRDAQDNLAEAYDGVRDAQRGVRDANEGVADAQRGVREAQENLAKATRDLGRAQRDAATGGDQLSTSATNVQNAFANLSPEAAHFTRFLFGLKDEFRSLRDAAGQELFPKLESAITRLVGGLFPSLRTVLQQAGSSLGDFAIILSKTFTKPDFLEKFTGFFDQFYNGVRDANGEIIKGGSPAEDFYNSIGNIITAFVGLSEAALPLIKRFSTFIETITGDWAKKTSGDTSALTETLNRAGDAAARIGDFLGSTFGAAMALIKPAIPLGERLIDTMTGGLDGFTKFANSADGKNKLGAYFDSLEPNIKAVGRFIRELVKEFAKLGQDPRVGEAFDELTKSLPTLVGVIGDFTGIAPDLIKFLESVLETFSKVSESEAFSTFVNVIRIAFDTLTTILNIPGVGTFAIGLLTLAAGFKAISVFTKFTGLKALAQIFAKGIFLKKENAQGLKGFYEALRGTKRESDALSDVIGTRLGRAFRTFRDDASDAEGPLDDLIQTIRRLTDLSPIRILIDLPDVQREIQRNIDRAEAELRPKLDTSGIRRALEATRNTLEIETINLDVSDIQRELDRVQARVDVGDVDVDTTALDRAISDAMRRLDNFSSQLGVDDVEIDLAEIQRELDDAKAKLRVDSLEVPRDAVNNAVREATRGASGSIEIDNIDVSSQEFKNALRRAVLEARAGVNIDDIDIDPSAVRDALTRATARATGAVELNVEFDVDLAQARRRMDEIYNQITARTPQRIQGAIFDIDFKLQKLEQANREIKASGEKAPVLFSDGMREGLAQVRAASDDVAKEISDRLKQNSPAAAGPLSIGGGTRGWGQDAGELFADGMRASTSEVVAAAERIAREAADGLDIDGRAIGREASRELAGGLDVDGRRVGDRIGGDISDGLDSKRGRLKGAAGNVTGDFISDLTSGNITSLKDVGTSLMAAVGSGLSSAAEDAFSGIGSKATDELGDEIADGTDNATTRGAKRFGGITGKFKTAASGLAGVARGVGAAMTVALGPVGLIVIGIGLLVAAFVTAYKKSETFRRIVDGALRAVGDAFGWLWDKVKQVFGFIKDNWDKLLLIFAPGIAAIIAIFKNWDKIKEIVGNILGAVKDFFGKMKDKVVDIVVGAKDAVVKKFTDLKDGAVDRVKKLKDAVLTFFTDIRTGISDRIDKLKQAVKDKFQAIKDAISEKVKNAKDAVFGFFTDIRTGVGDRVDRLKTSVREKFQAIKDAISEKIRNAKESVLGLFTDIRTGIGDRIQAAKDRVSNILDKIKEAFQKTKDGIKTAWDKLREIFRKPIDFVINTVYNDGIRSFWNKLAGVTGLPELGRVNFATGGVADGKRARGVLPGYSPGNDTVRAMLSPGEGILVPEAVRGIAKQMGVSSAQAINAINAQYTSRVPGRGNKKRSGDGPGFAGGGLLGRVGDGFSWVGGKFKAGAGFVLGGLRKLAGAALGFIVEQMTNAAPEGGLRDMLRGMGQKITDAIKGKAEEADKKATLPGEGGGASTGMGYQNMMRILHGPFPGLPLISGLRPGAITATGNRSYHASGRATDLPPRADVFEWIRSNFFNQTRELIFSPKGARQIWNGRPHVYTGITKAMHYDHVHWAMKNGGLVRGKGGPLDDLNLRLLSAGEFVVNAAATRQFLPLLEAINSGNLGEIQSGITAVNNNVNNGGTVMNTRNDAGGTHITLAPGAVVMPTYYPVGRTSEQTLNDRLRAAGELGIVSRMLTGES